ncbi:MAG: hypothetical protein R2713_17435 [Ilumatobacteraceae bacterium]
MTDAVLGHHHVDRLPVGGIVASGDGVEHAAADAQRPVAFVGTGEEFVPSGEHGWEPCLERVAAQDTEAEGVDRADGHLLDGRDEARRGVSSAACSPDRVRPVR